MPGMPAKYDETHAAGMVLHLPRLRRHLFRPTLEPQVHPLLLIRSIIVRHFQPGVGGDDRELLKVLHDPGFVRRPVPRDEDLHFRSDPTLRVGFLFVLDDARAVLVNVFFCNGMSGHNMCD